MSLIQWTSDLETGIQEVDMQHHRIVEYINELDRARVSQSRAEVVEVLEDPIDYTLSHFAFEEELMRDAQYKYLGPHRKVHEIFTRKVHEMKMRFDAGEDVTAELNSMLSRWLFNHIKCDDANFAPVVKGYLHLQDSSDEVMRDRIRQEVTIALEKAQPKRRGILAWLFGT